jgi:hypothetical protein
MKRTMFFLATAAIFVGCSQTDVFNEVPEAPIGFTKAYVEKNTRAAFNSTSDFEFNGSTFGVFGFRTKNSNTEKVFGERSGETNGVEVTCTNNGTDPATWGYTTTRYWDRNATSYSFYAYAPFVDDWGTGNSGASVTIPSSNDPTGFKISAFTQASTPANMIDLLKDFTSQSTNNSFTNTVDFDFVHILSSINLKMAVGASLKADATNNPVTVVSVSINGIQMNSNEYKFTTGNPGSWGWTMNATPSTANFNATQKTVNQGQANEANVVFGSNELAADAYSTVPGLSDLLFIPQVVPDSYTITVQYKIGEIVYDAVIKLNDFEDNSQNALTTWVPGYRYTYQLIIGPDPIVFGVVDNSLGWTDATYTYTIE